MATVREIQTWLSELGYSVGKIDGLAGPKYRAAVKAFQTKSKLYADGVVGPKTLHALESAFAERPFTPAPETPSHPLYVGRAQRMTPAQFSALALQYGIDEPSVRAIMEVEAGGSGFYKDGKLKCLYEPHIAYRETLDLATRSALVDAGLAYKNWVSGKYPKTSFERIDLCVAIAGERIAALSTSWGGGQMMGFNHETAGYSDPVAMVRAFADSEAAQLDGMLKFITSQPAMFNALKRRDWAGFASRYNGSKYKVNRYDTKLAAAYARYK